MEKKPLLSRRRKKRGLNISGQKILMTLRKKSLKQQPMRLGKRSGLSIVGIVLGIICLVLTIINSAIGAYQGYHGEAWFQKGSNTIEENVSDNQPSGKQETNVFTLRDSDGNILMTGGIKSAEATMVVNGDGIKKAVVQIEFDDESTKTFADITTNNIGNTIGIYLNEMITNPRVMCAITEGSCQIEVDTYEQAQVLSEALEKCK